MNEVLLDTAGLEFGGETELGESGFQVEEELRFE